MTNEEKIEAKKIDIQQIKDVISEIVDNTDISERKRNRFDVVLKAEEVELETLINSTKD